MCSIIHEVFFTRRSISKNLFDCGCEIHGNFQWPQVKNFPENCIVLYGNIIIDGNAPPVEVLYRLSTVNKLYGFIQIKSSNLETLGFLQNLDEIESGIILSHNQAKIKRLKLALPRVQLDKITANLDTI